MQRMVSQLDSGWLSSFCLFSVLCSLTSAVSSLFFW
jgi:hypothetical protein